MKKVLIIRVIALILLVPWSACSNQPHGLIYQSDFTLWILDPDHLTKREFTKSDSFAAALSNDLHRLAYSSDSYDLWITDIGRVNGKQVLKEELRSLGLEISRLSWSPDNTKIALLATPVDSPRANPERFTLYVIDLSTDTLRAIGTGITEFEWTRDGERLVVLRLFDPQEPQGIFLVSTTGLVLKELHMGLAEPYIAIAQSSDQVVIVAPKSKDYFPMTLFNINLQSGEIVDLLPNPKVSIHTLDDPAWSPDGRSVAFIGTVPDENNLAIPILFIVDVQTHNLREVAKDIRGPIVWSPSGRTIATTIMFSTDGVYEVNVETGKLRKLTDDRLATPSNFLWR